MTAKILPERREDQKVQKLLKRIAQKKDSLKTPQEEVDHVAARIVKQAEQDH